MKLLNLVMLSFLFLGCSIVPIQNIENVKIMPTQKKEHVKRVITNSATARGWKLSEKNESTLRAQLFVRSHEVIIDIPYTGSSFGISYVESKNMKYDGKVIHKKYMSWIQRLRTDILRNM